MTSEEEASAGSPSLIKQEWQRLKVNLSAGRLGGQEGRVFFFIMINDENGGRNKSGE